MQAVEKEEFEGEGEESGDISDMFRIRCLNWLEQQWRAEKKQQSRSQSLGILPIY